MKAISLFLTDGANVHHELLSGQVPETGIPGFIVAMSRLREQVPIEVYVDHRQVLGWRVLSTGQFQLTVRKSVPNG